MRTIPHDIRFNSFLRLDNIVDHKAPEKIEYRDFEIFTEFLKSRFLSPLGGAFSLPCNMAKERSLESSKKLRHSP